MVFLHRRSPGVPGQPLRGERAVATALAGRHPGGPADGGVPGDRHHQRRHPGLQLVPCGAGGLQLGAALQVGSRPTLRAWGTGGSDCTNKVSLLLSVGKTPRGENMLKDNSFLICRWTSRLLPCPGYCRSCCSEHWGACVF